MFILRFEIGFEVLQEISKEQNLVGVCLLAYKRGYEATIKMKVVGNERYDKSLIKIDGDLAFKILSQAFSNPATTQVAVDTKKCYYCVFCSNGFPQESLAQAALNAIVKAEKEWGRY